MNMDDTRSSVAAAISVTGELTAAEDVTIYGCVEGRITLPDHDLTIARSAVVKARVVARSVLVSGSFEGNITGAERIHLLAGASVRGHLTTPSIVMTEGATFTGTVDPDRSAVAMQVARYRERHRA
jgi:cytoskeletal protein CcmA (bactofilin family)